MSKDCSQHMISFSDDIPANGGTPDVHAQSIIDDIKNQYNRYKNDKWFWSTLILAVTLIVVSLWFFYRVK